jgi:hypothetical protein
MSKARNMARMGQDTSAGYTGAFDMPAGTTAQRPASAGLGWTRLNTDTGSVEIYDGTNWNAVTRPSILSATGTIYAGIVSNLVIAGQNFTSTITVRFLENGSTVADVNNVAVSSGSATIAVPAAVYGQTAGDSIQVMVINADGTSSANAITKTVQGLPSGGTITTSGNYRIHTFNSSDNFVVPSGFSTTAEYLIVAGGAGGGCRHAGGGGAGGLLQGSLSTSVGTSSIIVGAGGAGSTAGGVVGFNGANSSYPGLTAIGGGGGGSFSEGNLTSPNGIAGGSGGGGANGTGNTITGVGGSGTSGQGNSGGNGQGGADWAGGGGGGAGGAGQTNPNTNQGGAGGVGIQSSISGTALFYAGGGGGGGGNTANTGGAGGSGVGGTGSGAGGTNPAQSGMTNRGGGGGGHRDASGGNGGSGVVIIRYNIINI